MAQFFEAQKHMATDVIHITKDPVLEKDEASKLAAWFKPVRYALCNGDGVNDYSGRIFHGWMGSNLFLALAHNRLYVREVEDIHKAMSIAQYPPVPESPPEAIQQYTMSPLVQVYWTQQAGADYWFVRLHPYLRYADSTMALDGTQIAWQADWKKGAWEQR